MSINHFDWKPIYEELATKLPAFAYRRGELIEKVKQIYEKTGIKMPTLDKDNNLTDIDPFTFFGLFNKGITQENRNSILAAISDLFGLTSPLPSTYDGIPVLNLLAATYYRFSGERDADDIDDLWKLFIAALQYANDASDKNRASFAEFYSRIIKMKGIGNSKLTMGLYWIAPEFYMNLDSRNVWYIYDADKLPAEFVETLPKVTDRIKAELYLKIRDRFLEAFKQPNFPFHNFMELSYEAWRYSEEDNQREKLEKAKAQMKEVGDGLPDAGVRTPHYWLFSPGEGASMWETFYQSGIMAINWNKLGDLRTYTSREAIREKLQNLDDSERSYKNDSLALWQFANDVQPGDIVYTKNGIYSLVGRGIVTSEYQYDDSAENYCHFHQVNWTHKGNWPHPGKAVTKTLTDITQYTEYVQDLEKLFLGEEEPGDELHEIYTPEYPPYDEQEFLQQVYMDKASYDTLVGLIRKKKNVILQGAPGVGKTYAAKRLAYSIIGRKDQDRIMMVQFHQSYSYEDFIEGFRPSGSGNGFEIKKGTFYHFCKKAAEDIENPYFFIIDEINRGNLSRIFGELFMLIENDKRGNSLQLLYSDEKFFVPSNVYIIGMMNTADRSLAMLDYALRRRFSFFDMKPAFESEQFREYRIKLDSDKFNRLIERVEQLNDAIRNDDSLGEGFCIGHSYFCNLAEVTDQALSDIVEYELSPLLREYWYDDRTKANDWISRLKDAIR